jgi:hypothetical protein
MLDLFDLRAVMTLERLLYKTMTGHLNDLFSQSFAGPLKNSLKLICHPL